MAIFNSFLLGQVSQSVGNVTMCQYRGESDARGKIKFRRDNPTPEMLDMRAKIRELGSLAKRLTPVIRKGFVGVGTGTTSNAFISLNMGAVEVTAEHVATVDFDQLRLASGLLIPPVMTVTLDASVNLIGGRVTAKGNVAITPLAIDASVTGSKLSTKSLTSYIKSATNLDIAALADFGIKLKYADNVQTVSGSATIADISVKDGKKTFLTAKKASASLSSIDLLKQNADVSSVAVDGLSVHAVNTKQGFDLAQLGQKNATTGNGKPNAGNEQSKAAANSITQLGGKINSRLLL